MDPVPLVRRMVDSQRRIVPAGQRLCCDAVAETIVDLLAVRAAAFDPWEDAQLLVVEVA